MQIYKKNHRFKIFIHLFCKKKEKKDCLIIFYKKICKKLQKIIKLLLT